MTQDSAALDHTPENTPEPLSTEEFREALLSTVEPTSR